MLYLLVSLWPLQTPRIRNGTTDAGAALVCSYVALLSARGIAWLIGRDVLRVGRAALDALICTTIIARAAIFGIQMTLALLGRRNLGSAVAYDAAVESMIARST